MLYPSNGNKNWLKLLIKLRSKSKLMLKTQSIRSKNSMDRKLIRLTSKWKI